MKKPAYDLNYHTYKGCCLYALCRYKEALEETKKGLSSELNVISLNINFNNLCRRDLECIVLLN
jgi:hypothetical protein